jgi:hypothetical protein
VDDPAKSGTTMVTIPATPAAVIPVFTGYAITGSGTAFSATRNSAAVGTAGQPIQDVITAIRTHAAGAACAIQFGNGTTALDIGEASILFNDEGGTWGAITLSGKITGSMKDQYGYLIRVNGNISVTSTADISNTAQGRLVRFYSPGTLTIAGGTVQSRGSLAVQNDSTGTVIVSGGTVTTTENFIAYVINNRIDGTINVTGGTVVAAGSITSTLSNMGAGTINISGGTVESRTAAAIVLTGPAGKVNVSGTAVLTSANTDNTGGTINISKTSGTDNTNLRLEMTGGTVRNTSTTTGNAIYNGSTGAINITGGTVSKAGNGGFAINNAGGGRLTTTGATIQGNVSQ